MGLLESEWKWHWRKDGDEADCGIYAETHLGQAYAIARCPRYFTPQQWKSVATRICKLHNAELARVHEQSAPDSGLKEQVRDPKNTQSAFEVVRDAFFKPRS